MIDPFVRANILPTFSQYLDLIFRELPTNGHDVMIYGALTEHFDLCAHALPKMNLGIQNVIRGADIFSGDIVRSQVAEYFSRNDTVESVSVIIDDGRFVFTRDESMNISMEIEVHQNFNGGWLAKTVSKAISMRAGLL